MTTAGSAERMIFATYSQASRRRTASDASSPPSMDAMGRR